MFDYYELQQMFWMIFIYVNHPEMHTKQAVWIADEWIALG